MALIEAVPLQRFGDLRPLGEACVDAQADADDSLIMAAGALAALQ
jgi:hypothetical protein